MNDRFFKKKVFFASAVYIGNDKFFNRENIMLELEALSKNDIDEFLFNKVDVEISMPLEVKGFDAIDVDLSTPVEIPPSEVIKRDKRLFAEICFSGCDTYERKAVFITSFVYVLGGRIFYRKQNDRLIASVVWD